MIEEFLQLIPPHLIIASTELRILDVFLGQGLPKNNEKHALVKNMISLVRTIWYGLQRSSGQN